MYSDILIRNSHQPEPHVEGTVQLQFDWLEEPHVSSDIT
jgi:hypothetical protein